MIPWHYSNPERSVESHRASSSRPKDAVKTRKGLLRPENRSRQPRISFWEPAHLVSRLRVATGVPRPCFFRAGERRSPPLAAVENMRKGPQVLYFEASPGGPAVTLVQASCLRKSGGESAAPEASCGAAFRVLPRACVHPSTSPGRPPAARAKRCAHSDSLGSRTRNPNPSECGGS